MSLMTYLRERRLTVAIVVVGLAAAGSQGLMWWLSPQAPEHDFVGPPRSGYTLHHFKMWSYGIDGLPSFSMTSPQLDRHDEDDTLYIITPNFVIPSKQPGVLPDLGESMIDASRAGPRRPIARRAHCTQALMPGRRDGLGAR